MSVPLLVLMVVGLILYILPIKVVEIKRIGEIMFFCALLAMCLDKAGSSLSLRMR